MPGPLLLNAVGTERIHATGSGRSASLTSIRQDGPETPAVFM